MNKLMYRYLSRISREYGERTAFRYFEQGELKEVTYSCFMRELYGTAAALQATIPQVKGKHIAILARNSYAYVVNLLSIMAVDAVAVTLNIEEGWNVLSQQIKTADVQLVLHDGEYLAEYPQLGESGVPLRKMESPTSEDQLRIETYEDPDAPALLMFTSGTTSMGKGVLLAHRSFWENLIAFLPEDEGKSCFLCSPLYHMAAIHRVIGWLRHGCTICINSNIRYLQKELVQFGCTNAFFVPRVIEFLYRFIKRNKPDELGKLEYITTASARLDPEMIQLFGKCNICIDQEYGLTETGGACTINKVHAGDKIKSVGPATPGVEISIQDGEICLKGNRIMLGYYNNPEATAAALRDGWLHTGDLGRLDEDGYLYITGRKKNLIILSSGENINPEEIEALLVKNPDITEVIVKEKERQVCAEIYCPPEKRDMITDYIEEINQSLAYYKHVTLIEFRDTPFDRTASGKIKRT